MIMQVYYYGDMGHGSRVQLTPGYIGVKESDMKYICVHASP
jgi:hypothetical protein